jgi:hypothetical protein
MNRIAISIAAFALLVAACSGSDSAGVASLEATETTATEVSSDDAAASDEETLLEFSACMRDNGIDDFEDPTFNADGTPEFSLRGTSSGSDADRDEMRAAFEACQDHLESLAFGRGSIDVTEVEDTLVDFAACMRDNGYDMPDPDLSNFGDRGGEGGGLFGGQLDPDDPGFVSAMEECEHIFENLPFVGGGPGSGGRRG